MSRERSTKRKALTPGFGGKLLNDRNKVGGQQPTQKNQGRRTPISRGDRQNHLGADNQSQERKRRSPKPSSGPMPDLG